MSEPGFDDLDLAALHRKQSSKWVRYPESVLPAWVAEMDYPIAAPICATLLAGPSRSSRAISEACRLEGTASAGEGAEATAPLGRAVIGGLAAATLATLIVLPSVYSLVQQSANRTSPSLDPDDPESAFRTQPG